MRFGAMNFPVMVVQDEINEFARMGFDYLELAMDPPMAHHSILSQQKKEIVSILRNNGMGLVCHLPTFLTTADLNERLRRASVTEMLISLDVAVELGAEKVVLHPSMVPGLGAFVPETVTRLACDFLSEMATAAQQLDVTLCLENMFPRNLLGVEPEYFEEMFRVFPTMKLTLDTGHANIADPHGSRLRKLTERLGKRIGHLHFSDNHGMRDDHLAIGEGSVDFADLVKSLKTCGYDDTITLEVFDKDRRLLVHSREKIRAMFFA